MRQASFFMFIWVLIWLLVACGGKAPSARVETIDGITHIYNLETPNQPEKNVRFVEELAIGEEDGNGNIILFEPYRIAVDFKGNIYIADRQDFTIKVFSPEGSLVRTIGRQGEGPGEFQYKGPFAFFPDGKLLVMDSQARRTSFFDSKGDFLNSYPWKNAHIRFFWLANNSYTVDDRIYRDNIQFSIKTFDLSGNEIRTIGEFFLPQLKNLQGEGMSFAMTVPYSPYSILCADANRKLLYHCMNDVYLIEVFDAEGKLIQKITRPYTPVPYTAEEQQEFKQRADERPDNPFSKMIKDMTLPSIKTITESMLVDDQSNLWLVTFEEKEQGDRKFIAYDIFNSEGFYEARIWTDIRPRIFLNGKMYSLEADEETGFQTVKRYRVAWEQKE